MSLTTKYTLKPTLRANFEGIIWKVETDPLNGIIAVETRNPQNRTASFSAFNFADGTTLFKEISVQDSWHWGLDLASHGFVYLHSYIDEKTPEHKAIIALDQSGQIAWQIFNRTLDSATEEGLVVYNPGIQQKQFELLNPLTGGVISRSIVDFRSVNRDLYFPETTTDPRHLAEAANGRSLVGPVFHLAYNNKDCYSFHVRNGSAFSQYLLIKSSGVTLHEEILEEHIQKLNPEPFYIEGDYLFCIRNNKAEIVAYLV